MKEICLRNISKIEWRKTCLFWKKNENISKAYSPSTWYHSNDSLCKNTQVTFYCYLTEENLIVTWIALVNDYVYTSSSTELMLVKFSWRNTIEIQRQNSSESQDLLEASWTLTSSERIVRMFVPCHHAHSNTSPTTETVLPNTKAIYYLRVCMCVSAYVWESSAISAHMLSKAYDICSKFEYCELYLQHLFAEIKIFFSFL